MNDSPSIGARPALLLVWALAWTTLPGASAAQEAAEVALLRSYLSLPPQRQLAAAKELEKAADLVVDPYMHNPVGMARQEQGIGPGAGFSTSVVGAEFTFDVAGKHSARAQAAQVRASRHDSRLEEQLLAGVCAVRMKILELEQLDAGTAVLRRTRERYQWVVEVVAALAEGQEKSRFDVARARLRLTVCEEQIAEAVAARASVGSGFPR